MLDWQKTLIAPSATLREALSTIDTGGVHIALIVDENRVLKGVLSDGDVRRGLLKGVLLEEPVTRLMNTTPTTARQQDDPDTVLVLMREKRRHQIPLLDAEGRVVGLKVLADLLQPKRCSTPVVLMAGGIGSRLRPLTHDTPKPLLRVGNKPILETILDGFIAQGFHRFYLAVNYKARMIEAHFGDGARWNTEITYLYEEERRGTAGALSLLPDQDEPLLVMNGDLLTNLNFGHLLNFHREHAVEATMCVRTYEYQIPYGVVEAVSHRIVSLQEKPVQQFLVNAGVYVLEPQVLNEVPCEGVFHMTDLFGQLLEAGREITVFPIHAYWMDIGHHDDFKRANGEYDGVFR